MYLTSSSILRCLFRLLVLTLVAVAPASLQADPLPIVPGENPNLFGMTTPAGSGRHLGTPFTNICKVTNLSDTGPGSLRTCLEVGEPRTIIFDVSGTIVLKSSLQVPAYTTIAGQTAPSPGITLRGWHVGVGGDDVLIQHLRIRIGDLPKGHSYGERDALVPCKSCKRLVFAYNSLSWSIDELVNAESSETTYLQNIFSEALHSPLHHKGPHSRALLITGSYDGGTATASRNVAVVGNLFAHNMSRNPVLSADATGVVVNNVNYNVNVAPKCDDHGEEQLCSVYNNVLQRAGRFVARADNDSTLIYIGTHLIDGTTYTYPGIWDSRVSTPFGRGVPQANRASTPPITVPGLELKPLAGLVDWVLANAGSRPADRDPVDERVVNNVRNETGNVIASQTEVGGWPTLAENYRPLTIPANPHAIQASGYTALEEWLHAFSRVVEGKGGTFPPGTPDAIPSPNPTVSVILWAEPDSIREGQSTTLKWFSAGASTCEGTGFNTQGETNGLATVSPTNTTSYTVECTNDSGSDTDSMTVGVVIPPNREAVALYHFNEGTGGTATDSSGQGNNGTITGATWTGGYFGQALSFDGIDDYVQSSLDLGELSMFTITAWIYPRVFDGREGVFSAAGLIVHYNLGQWEFVATDNTSSQICKMRMGSLLPVVNTWNFIALTYDGKDCALHYRDTYQSYPAADWKSLRSGTLRIGRGNAAYADSWFDGLIDEVYIFNYALSEEVLERVREGTLPGPVPSPPENLRIEGQ